MSEEKTISRLSVFIFGAGVFIIAIYHSFPFNVYWLSFLLSAAASFLSGIFLRKNKTPFKLKSILFMSSMLVMFPIFNFYVRENPFKFCFIFPIVIYLMFLAGHSIKFKKHKLKSIFVLLLSVIFIASSYFYVPYLLFHLNEKDSGQMIKQTELLKLNGDPLTSGALKGKVTLMYFGKNILKPDEIAKKFIKNDSVLIFYVFREDQFTHNLESIKDLKFEEKYHFKVLFDQDNKFLDSLNFRTLPGAILIDKNLTVRKLYMNRYFFFGNYYSKKITEEINQLQKE